MAPTKIYSFVLSVARGRAWKEFKTRFSICAHLLSEMSPFMGKGAMSHNVLAENRREFKSASAITSGIAITSTIAIASTTAGTIAIASATVLLQVLLLPVLLQILNLVPLQVLLQVLVPLHVLVL